jgi:hypothetical protein
MTPLHNMFLILIFKQPGWYLNFSTQFMKNVSSGEGKRKKVEWAKL